MLINTKQELRSLIKDASSSCSGYMWTGDLRLPLFDWSEYTRVPHEYSNHQVALEKLKSFGVVDATIAANGGCIHTLMFNTSDINKVPDEALDVVLKLIEDYNDYPVLDDTHLDTETVAEFENYAFRMNPDLVHRFESWDEAGYAFRVYTETYGSLDTFDSQFPLSSEENNLCEFEDYLDLIDELQELINLPRFATLDDAITALQQETQVTNNDWRELTKRLAYIDVEVFNRLDDLLQSLSDARNPHQDSML
jgi:hydroxymethylpyrimidine pyrophosphatase-like HAD family hydrolase